MDIIHSCPAQSVWQSFAFPQGILDDSISESKWRGQCQCFFLDGSLERESPAYGHGHHLWIARGIWQEATSSRNQDFLRVEQGSVLQTAISFTFYPFNCLVARCTIHSGYEAHCNFISLLYCRTTWIQPDLIHVVFLFQQIADWIWLSWWNVGASCVIMCRRVTASRTLPTVPRNIGPRCVCFS